MKKKICILNTGGTIGMVPTEQGYAPQKGFLASLLNEMPELKDEAMPEWEVVEFDPLLDSSNMTAEHWDSIGSTIDQYYDDYDGFVILHGTDTMSYTASALSFMLENLNKPVILTGSQIPLCKLRSDGRDNIIDSMIIASEGIVREVCLYFGGKLYQNIPTQAPSELKHSVYVYPDFKQDITHRIRIAENSPLHKLCGELEMGVNSLHHQGVKEIAPGLVPMAWAEDGLVESWYLDSDDQWMRGYQWHPEMMDGNPYSELIFKDFISRCIANRDK